MAVKKFKTGDELYIKVKVNNDDNPSSTNS